MSSTIPKVDGYIRKSKEWQEELRALRQIILDCDLTEDVKWRTPCYTVDGGNVLFIGRFKEGCVLSFIKGALLKDPKGILLKPGENTQSGRVIKFTSTQQIADLEPTLKAYIREAVAAEKAGLKVQFKKTEDFDFPEEFQAKLDELPAFKAAFDALTPGRQRGYLLHFSSAKQSKTRTARVEKWLPHIMNGKGMDDA
jgi:uncharacterized protein YdeI (YjbR/CyaY-like superfamily)